MVVKSGKERKERKGWVKQKQGTLLQGPPELWNALFTNLSNSLREGRGCEVGSLLRHLGSGHPLEGKKKQLSVKEKKKNCRW